MALHDLVSCVQTKADLVTFIEALREDFKTKPIEWENATLERYLAALASWLEDSAGYYRAMDGAEPAVPSWRTVADMLIAAKMYE